MDASQTPRSRPRIRFGIVSLLYFMTSLCVAFAAAAASRGHVGVGLAVFGGTVMLWGTIQWAAYRRNPFGWIFAGIVIVVITIALPSGVIADGHANVSVRVVVIDGESGRALRNARVRALDLSSSPREAPDAGSLPSEVKCESFSGTDGTASITYVVPYTRHSLWYDTREVVRLDYYVWLEVEADGYSRYCVPLDSIYGDYRNVKELPLPPLTVNLEPTN